MAALKYLRIVIFNLLCILPLIFAQTRYVIPEVKIQALRPRGVRISMATEPNMYVFIFRGNINEPLTNWKSAPISIHKSIYHDTYEVVSEISELKLYLGDVINYYVYVSVLRDRRTNGKEMFRDKRSATITELMYTNGTTVTSTQPPTTTSVPPPECISTVTTVLGRDTSACSGDVIFEDHFDTLREDVWKIEQYIPTKPEYPFVSYQRPPNATTVSVQEGMLRIEPKLQQALPGFNADSTTMNDYVLDLTSGCTQPLCSYTNAGAQIMPPIASGRLTSSTFSFKYGVIEVRAKLPQGDWLYPDIILEPQAKKYGFENYASGILRIAGARGNMILKNGIEEYGNKVLYGGPIMDFKCRTHLITKKTSESAWGDDFHVYSLWWDPEKITLYVDGEEYGTVEPNSTGLHSYLPKYFCNPPRAFFKTPLAPFDDYFRITLGVSAGGISEFPDHAKGPNSEPKPWKNNAHHAKLTFYDDMNSWYPWPQPALLVDYIKVRAL